MNGREKRVARSGIPRISLILKIVRLKGYILCAVWCAVLFVLPALASGRPADIVPERPAAGRDSSKSSHGGWRRLDSLTPDSVLVSAGICDSALTVCDFSLAAMHPDSLDIGVWVVPGRDSLTQEERTQRFYDTLQVRADRSGFWKFIHGLLVVPHGGTSQLKPEIVDEATVYGVYNGKRIDSIEFVRKPVFDPARSYLEKGANAVHVTTGVHAIKRDLLFKEGEAFDADAVVRYKQLLRSREYIADAAIEVLPVPDDPDAVIVRVITRDSWSISADGSIRGLTGQVKGELYDANFLGTGDRLSYQLSLDWRKKKYEGSMFRYYIPNLFGTFYEATLQGGRSFTERYYGATLNKNFIQPSDYGIGAVFENVRNAMYVRYETATDTVAASYMLHYNNVDLWGGQSWYLPDVGSSVYATARFENVRYLSPPTLYEAEDPPRNPDELPVGPGLNPYFYDRSLTLAAFGFYNERFLTTSLIYGYGYDEYIATGYRAEATFGYMHSDYQPGWYGGVSLRSGGFTPIGYFMGDMSVGTFYSFRQRRPFQSALNLRLDYFTNMLGRRKFKLRQFVSLNYLNGWNRSDGFYEAVWFTPASGPRAMHDSPLGRNRLVVSAESVVFTPWQPLGFRIALYGFGDVGFLGYDRNVFRNACYATVGAGIRLKNEMLVFGTIQLSIFVNFGKHGPMSNEWIQLTSEQRMQTLRYIPTRPEVVPFQ